MAYDAKKPFFIPSFTTGLIVAYGVAAFLLGAEIDDLYARKPSFAVGGAIASLVGSALVVKTFEGTLHQEAENKAKEYLSPYRSRLDELEVVIETLETESDREHALEIVSDLRQTIQAFEQEYQAAQKTAELLKKDSYLEDLRNQGIKRVISKYQISEEKAQILFTHDINNYLILLRETLPSLEPWEFEAKHLCLAYQEGLVTTIDPYADAINFITQILEDKSGNTGVVSSVSRLFLTQLNHLPPPPQVQVNV